MKTDKMHSYNRDDNVISYLKNLTPFDNDPLFLSIINRLPSEDKDYLFKKYNELLDAAHEDTLTGAYNRSKFEKDLGLVVSMAKRLQEKGTCFGYVDVDNLKFINDSIGHDEGDRLLVNIADSVKKSLRDYDGMFFYRIGGDEFAFILLNASLEEGRHVSERIRKSVEEKCTSTISIGLSHYTQITDNINALVKTADIALYESKKSRNIVTAYTKNP